ncbi:MAG: hypothetical protein H7329_19180 [Opitutaceae bacterium]|nr:hypothetical protein [Cytophagales bacterium]
MRTVLVFKTSVTFETMPLVKPVLDKLELIEKWNFDLEDCDRILRVETVCIQATVIMEKMKSLGLFCEELED